jgi:hypothetical protein
MDAEEEKFGDARKGLAGSWQDISGQGLLHRNEEGRWEAVAGGRHKDVVALDSNQEVVSPKKQTGASGSPP